MKALVFAVLLLPLVVWAGCSRTETPLAPVASETTPQPTSPPPETSQAAVTDADQAAALQAQAEQLMLMQLIQMQQQIAAQNIQRLGEIGADASEQVYRQGVVNGCYLQGNCEVRTVTVPVY